MRRFFQQYMTTLLGGGAVGILIGYIIVYPVMLIVGAAITHLFAMMFGAAKNGFNATARVFAYATAPYLLGWIPCCGGIVAPIYAMVLTIWGLGRAQETTMVRAALAVLAFPVLLCCCALGIGVIAGMAGASAGAH
jgi:hypothetical protein